MTRNGEMSSSYTVLSSNRRRIFICCASSITERISLQTLFVIGC